MLGRDCYEWDHPGAYTTVMKNGIECYITSSHQETAIKKHKRTLKLRQLATRCISFPVSKGTGSNFTTSGIIPEHTPL